jgi:hypothetical protein
MDNDVELTNCRSRFDSDEVYPLEDLRKNEIYQPVARRQNKCFLLGVALCLMLFFVLIGRPHDDEAIKSQGSVEHVEQGGLVKNDHNAKVAEAMQNNALKPGKSKPHASASWSGNDGKDAPSKGDPVNVETRPEEEQAATENDLTLSTPEPTDEAPVTIDQPASENMDEPLGTKTPKEVAGIDNNPNTQPSENQGDNTGQDPAISVPEPTNEAPVTLDQPASENMDEPLTTQIPHEDAGIDDNSSTQPPENQGDNTGKDPDISVSESTNEAPVTIDQPASENMDEPLGSKIPKEDATIDNNPNTPPTGSQGDSNKRNFDAWHDIKVTKNDGIMYEVTEVLKHDPKSFT